MTDVVKYVSGDGKYGRAESRQWVLNHSLYEMIMVFPEAAEKAAETYGLPDRILPGIRIRFSDTGAYATEVSSILYFNDDDRYVTIDSSEFKHNGLPGTEELFAVADRQIEYACVYGIEQLAALKDKSAEPAIKPQAQNRRKVETERTVAALSKKMKLARAIGKSREMDVKKKLVDALTPLSGKTMYELAVTMMRAGSLMEDLPGSLEDLVAEACGRVPDLLSTAGKHAMTDQAAG